MTDSISTLNLEAGQVVGGYTLVSRLGGGAMGTVWTVRDDAGQLFAMKILRDSLSEEDSNNYAAGSEEQREQVTARERLRREALALSRVRHPGVASIVDMELDDALAFIVTELIDGDNLREDVATNGAYTGEDLELLTEKLSSAVQAVHKAGIIHRDIKPTNVMISATGPVLVDFGIAMGEGESHVTRTGLVMGTPGFIAPEVIEGSESDEATDWWSVASVLAFAATGKPVFGTKPIMAVLEREASGNADLAGLPEKTAQAFKAALSPHRHERISVDQLLAVVRHDALASEFGGGTADTAVSTIPLPPKPEATGFPALSDPKVQENPGPNVSRETGVVRPFDRAPLPPRGGPVSRPQSLRTLWERTPDDTATRPFAQTISYDPNDPNVPGGTRVMPQGGAPSDALATETLPASETPTVALPLDAAERASDADPLARLHQPIPETQTPPAAADAEETVSYAAAPLAAPATLTPGATPVVIPPRQILAQQVHERFKGSGKTLALVLTLPVVLMCTWLPTGGAVIALIILWLAASRGYSIHAQILRESKRGGEKKRFDGALSVIALPVHLVRGLLLTIPKALLWILFYTLANLLTFTLASPEKVTSGISLFSRTFTFDMVAGSPRSLSGAVLAVTAGLAWLACAALNASPSPVASGLASAWNSLRRGVIKVTEPSFGETSGDANAAALAGNPPESHTTKRSVIGVVLLVLLVAFIIASAAMFFVTTSIDWSPIVVA
ncbi:MAG: protein kinase [Bifidobacteriaceae bacterium]|jgi:serine/threonine protein kinase|nr:protein kinase [Bifidobacteriaceae bacterium]